MSDAVLEREKAIAVTSARLEAVLQKAREDEAKLKRFLEIRRLKRRLLGGKTK